MSKFEKFCSYISTDFFRTFLKYTVIIGWCWLLTGIVLILEGFDTLFRTGNARLGTVPGFLSCEAFGIGLAFVGQWLLRKGFKVLSFGDLLVDGILVLAISIGLPLWAIFDARNHKDMVGMIGVGLMYLPLGIALVVAAVRKKRAAQAVPNACEPILPE